MAELALSWGPAPVDVDGLRARTAAWMAAVRASPPTACLALGALWYEHLCDLVGALVDPAVAAVPRWDLGLRVSATPGDAANLAAILASRRRGGAAAAASAAVHDHWGLTLAFPPRPCGPPPSSSSSSPPLRCRQLSLGVSDAWAWTSRRGRILLRRAAAAWGRWLAASLAPASVRLALGGRAQHALVRSWRPAATSVRALDVDLHPGDTVMMTLHAAASAFPRIGLLRVTLVDYDTSDDDHDHPHHHHWTTALGRWQVLRELIVELHRQVVAPAALPRLIAAIAAHLPPGLLTVRLVLPASASATTRATVRALIPPRDTTTSPSPSPHWHWHVADCVLDDPDTTAE